MKAVILCNSEERGLFPVNERTPDCLVDICGETSLSLCINAAEKAGLRDLYLAAGRNIPQLTSLYGDYEMIHISEQIGSELSERSLGESLLIMSARYAVAPDIAGMLDTWHRSSESQPAAVILACKKCLGHGHALRSEHGRLLSFANDCWSSDGDHDGFFGGAAVLSPGLSSRLGEYDFMTLEELIFALLSDDEHISVFYSDDELFVPDTPQNYRLTCLSLLRKRAVIMSEIPNVTIIPPVYIGKDATLGDGCVISNCVIGQGARIGARCELNGSVIGECSVISAGVSADEAVVCRSAEIGACVRLGRDCVVGENTIVGSGSDIASGVRLRADGRISADKLVTDDCVCEASISHTLDDDDCFTPDKASSAAIDCVRIGMAAGSALEWGSMVVCGCTPGEVSCTLLSSFENGLSAVGITAMSVGVSSRSEVMFLISRLGAQMGCFVCDENTCNINLMAKGGLPLDTKQRSDIERSFALRMFRSVIFSEYAERREISGTKALYMQFLSRQLPERFIGFNVDVRCSDQRLSSLAESLFRPRGDISGERIIFHISNDGSECTAYTDGSGNISHERLVLFAAKASFEKELPVSLPFSFPTAADTVAESLAGKLYRYRHSSEPESDSAARAVASRPDNFFVRDALALICMICSYINEHDISAAQAFASLPEFATVRRFAAGGMTANEAYRRLGASREGGEGVVARYGGRASVRPLRDRKGLLIYAEGTSTEAAAAICDDIMKTLGIDREI